MIAHKPLKTYHYLKQLSIYLSFIFVALVLVGCASNKSTGVTTSVTSGVTAGETVGGTPDETVGGTPDDTVGGTPDDTVDDSLLPPISDLMLDRVLHDIRAGIRERGNFISTPVQSDTSVISQSSTRLDSGGSDSIETLMARVTEVNPDDHPLYEINYRRNLPADGMIWGQFAITTDSSSLTVEHFALTSSNDINLKLSAISYNVVDITSGRVELNGNIYSEIYTNYGEDDGNGGEFNDSNYLAMGNWLFVPTGTETQSYSIGSFVNGADILSASQIQGITNTENVTYTGAAYGFALLFVSSADRTTEAVPLQAEVHLTANFDTNTINGIINNFQIRSGTAFDAASDTTLASGGAITLSTRDIDNSDGGFASTDGVAEGRLDFTIKAVSGAITRVRSHDYEGTWNSNFYGNAADGPDRVAGTVAGKNNLASDNFPGTDSALHLSFGGYKDTP